MSLLIRQFVYRSIQWRKAVHIFLVSLPNHRDQVQFKAIKEEGYHELKQYQRFLRTTHNPICKLKELVVRDGMGEEEGGNEDGGGGGGEGREGKVPCTSVASAGR